MTFADPRIQHYLSTKDIVILGTINPDGSPLVTAMWFLHEPAALTLISVDNLQKVKNLRRDPRLHIVAESGSRGAEIKGVAIRGRAEFLADSPERRALVTRIVDKYHPHLEKYWKGRTMPADRVMFRVVPSRCASGARLSRSSPARPRVALMTGSAGGRPPASRGAACRPRWRRTCRRRRRGIPGWGRAGAA